MAHYHNFPDFISAVRVHTLDCDKWVSATDIPERKLLGYTCECEQSWYLPTEHFLAYRRRNSSVSSSLGQLVREYNMEHRRPTIVQSLFAGLFDSIPWMNPYADDCAPKVEPVKEEPDDKPSNRKITPICPRVYQKKVTAPVRGVHISVEGWYSVRGGKEMFLRPGFYVLEARGNLPKRVKLAKFLEDHDDYGLEADEAPHRFEREDPL